MASADVLPTARNLLTKAIYEAPARHEQFKATLLRHSPLVSTDRIKCHPLCRSVMFLYKYKGKGLNKTKPEWRWTHRNATWSEEENSDKSSMNLATQRRSCDTDDPHFAQVQRKLRSPYPRPPFSHATLRFSLQEGQLIATSFTASL